MQKIQLLPGMAAAYPVYAKLKELVEISEVPFLDLNRTSDWSTTHDGWRRDSTLIPSSAESLLEALSLRKWRDC